MYYLTFFQFLAPVALATIVLSGAPPGGYSYNRFRGPVSGQIVEVQVPAAEGIPAQQHADYGYDHQSGQIHPDTAKYAHLKTVDYVVSALCKLFFSALWRKYYVKHLSKLKWRK